MASISKDKSKILLTSFYDLPLVKLYTAKINTKNLIYSKIKGVFCFLCDKNKNSNDKKYYLRIYSINNYSILFNVELKKEDLQYYIKIRDILYCLQTKECLICFQFNTIEKAEKFYLQIKNEPNKDIVNQNERAFNIDSSKLNINIYKDIIDSIKDELEKNTKYNKNIANINTRITINEDNGEFIDFSNIHFLYLLMNNIEFDNEDNKLNFYVDKNFNKKKYQNIINQFNKNNISNFPMQIIDKDFCNILNKKKYIDIMINNIIQTIKEKENLKKYKNENRKKVINQKQIEQQNKINDENNNRKLSTAFRKVKISSKNKEIKRKNHSVEKRKVNISRNYNVNNSIKQYYSLQNRKPKNIYIKENKDNKELNKTISIKKKNENENKTANKYKNNIENKKYNNIKTAIKINDNKLKMSYRNKEKEMSLTDRKKGIYTFSIGGIFKKKNK